MLRVVIVTQTDSDTSSTTTTSSSPHHPNGDAWGSMEGLFRVRATIRRMATFVITHHRQDDASAIASRFNGLQHLNDDGCGSMDGFFRVMGLETSLRGVGLDGGLVWGMGLETQTFPALSVLFFPFFCLLLNDITRLRTMIIMSSHVWGWPGRRGRLQLLSKFFSSFFLLY
jgi:hypothetical protein